MKPTIRVRYEVDVRPGGDRWRGWWLEYETFNLKTARGSKRRIKRGGDEARIIKVTEIRKEVR